MLEKEGDKTMILHPELQAKLDEYDCKRAFSEKEFVDKRCQAIIEYLKQNNLKATVVSVSGGVDSAVVLSLLIETRQRYPEYPFKIVALAQPIHSTLEIQARAYELAEQKGIKLITIDQSSEHETIIQKIEEQTGELYAFSKSMFKSYQRTPTAYLLASHYQGIVVGTGNLDEDGYLYYYCKFGDGAVDVSVIWDIHKNEVFKVAKYLDVPKSILNAPPSADLFPGQTDEGELGVSYDMVRLVYYSLNDNNDSWINNLSEEAIRQFIAEKRKIEQVHERGLHKKDLNPVLL